MLVRVNVNPILTALKDWEENEKTIRKDFEAEYGTDFVLTRINRQVVFLQYGAPDAGVPKDVHSLMERWWSMADAEEKEHPKHKDWVRLRGVIYEAFDALEAYRETWNRKKEGGTDAI